MQFWNQCFIKSSVVLTDCCSPLFAERASLSFGTERIYSLLGKRIFKPLACSKQPTECMIWLVSTITLPLFGAILLFCDPEILLLQRQIKFHSIRAGSQKICHCHLSTEIGSSSIFPVLWENKPKQINELFGA